MQRIDPGSNRRGLRGDGKTGGASHLPCSSQTECDVRPGGQGVEAPALSEGHPEGPACLFQGHTTLNLKSQLHQVCGKPGCAGEGLSRGSSLGLWEPSLHGTNICQ